jgi:ferredoxin
MSVAVSVDPDLCIGSGECVRIVPAAFALDDDEGVSHPTPLAGESDLALLLEAARSCPTQAIAVGPAGALLDQTSRGPGAAEPRPR